MVALHCRVVLLDGCSCSGSPVFAIVGCYLQHVDTYICKYSLYLPFVSQSVHCNRTWNNNIQLSSSLAVNGWYPGALKLTKNQIANETVLWLRSVCAVLWVKCFCSDLDVYLKWKFHRICRYRIETTWSSIFRRWPKWKTLQHESLQCVLHYVDFIVLSSLVCVCICLHGPLYYLYFISEFFVFHHRWLYFRLLQRIASFAPA